MKVLLVSATEFEIASYFKQKDTIDVLLTGVGIPIALYHLQKKITENRYNLVIQVGLAGAFTTKFELGETVFVNQDTFGDLGIEEKERFTPIFETDLFNKNEFPFENGWLVNKNKILQQSTLEVVKAVTINKVTDKGNIKQQLIDSFNPDIETMEGAALHYVCLHQNIPFIQLRAISNYVGERDKTKWKIDLAISNLHNELIKLLKQYLCYSYRI
jgi:futalosine hydrolase